MSVQYNVSTVQCQYNTMSVQYNVSTIQCQYNTMSLQYNVSTIQCQYNTMSVQYNVSTVQCQYHVIAMLESDSLHLNAKRAFRWRLYAGIREKRRPRSTWRRTFQVDLKRLGKSWILSRMKLKKEVGGGCCQPDAQICAGRTKY